MKKSVLVLVLSAFAAAPALADLPTVDATEKSMGANLVMTIHTNYPSGPQATATGSAVYVGVQNILLTKNAGHPWPSISGFPSQGATIGTFCIDIWDWSSSRAVEYQVVPLGDAPDWTGHSSYAGVMEDRKAGRIAELLTNAHWGPTVSLTDGQAATLQAAIWEIINESPDLDPSAYDVKSGWFYLDGDATALGNANTMLRALSVNGIDPSGYMALTSPAGQDYLVRVPLPGAVLLGLLGVGAAGLKLRKFA